MSGYIVLANGHQRNTVTSVSLCYSKGLMAITLLSTTTNISPDCSRESPVVAIMIMMMVTIRVPTQTPTLIILITLILKWTLMMTIQSRMMVGKKIAD